MDCIYENCNSKRIQLRDSYMLKEGEVRLVFRCEKCEKFFDDRLVPWEKKTKWSEEMEEYLYNIMAGIANSIYLKKGQTNTCTNFRKALKEKFSNQNGPIQVMSNSSIQSRMNKFMAEHGVSTLPLSPSLNLQ